jgi:hypothetical protein
MAVFAQTVFTNSVRQSILTYAPSADADTVIAAGSTKMKQIVPSNELGGLLLARSTSLDRTFYLGASIAVVSLFFSCSTSGKDIRKKGEKTDQQG